MIERIHVGKRRGKKFVWILFSQALLFILITNDIEPQGLNLLEAQLTHAPRFFLDFFITQFYLDSWRSQPTNCQPIGYPTSTSTISYDNLQTQVNCMNHSCFLKYFNIFKNKSRAQNRRLFIHTLRQSSQGISENFLINNR